jgi:hypothetical protein
MVQASWMAGLGFALVLLSSPARADWTEDFDGGFDQSWTFLAIDDEGDPPSSGVSEFDIIDDGADGYLRISHSTTAIFGGGGGASDGFGWVSESFTTSLTAADINAAPGDGQQNFLGVFARGDTFFGTAYVAGIDFANSLFGIVAADNFFDSLFVLASDSSIVIDPNETYRVELYLIDRYQFARLIEVSSGEVVSTLTANDSFYTGGVSGLLVETEYSGVTPQAPIVGTFDNVEAVPEPSLGILVGFGVAGLALLGRSRG